jgi:hypothetical protein
MKDSSSKYGGISRALIARISPARLTGSNSVFVAARAASSLASRWDSPVYMMPRERSNGRRWENCNLAFLPGIGGGGERWKVEGGRWERDEGMMCFSTRSPPYRTVLRTPSSVFRTVNASGGVIVRIRIVNLYRHSKFESKTRNPPSHCCTEQMKGETSEQERKKHAGGPQGHVRS